MLAGRPVARIGFGAMQLSGPGGRPAPAREAALAVLRRALELGVTHIDTAHFYGAGRSNELIRAGLHPYPTDLVIVSKVGAEAGDQHGPRAAQRPEQLRSGVEANLRSLGVERIDVVNLRRMDSGLRTAQGDQIVDIDSQLAELQALRDEGKIGALGLSNVTLDQLRRSLPFGIVCVQNAYNLLNRSDEPLLDICRRTDIAWVPYFPLGSSFPGLPKVTEHPAVVTEATRLRVTPAQLAVAWLLQHDSHILTIAGTASQTHLEENVAAGNLELDADTVECLDNLAASGTPSAIGGPVRPDQDVGS